MSRLEQDSPLAGLTDPYFRSVIRKLGGCGLIVTEMAVIEPTDTGLFLCERGPGVSIDEIEAATSAELATNGDVPEMALA